MSKSAIVSVIKEATCAIWTALQAQHMPSPTEEIFQETAKDFNIRWNFPNCAMKYRWKAYQNQMPAELRQPKF